MNSHPSSISTQTNPQIQLQVQISKETLTKLKGASLAQAASQSLGMYNSHDSLYGNFLIPILPHLQ